MLPHDPKGIQGPKIPLDDVVTILEPKEEISPATLLAQQQAAAMAAAPMMAAPPMEPAMAVEPAVMVEDPNVAAGF